MNFGINKCPTTISSSNSFFWEIQMWANPVSSVSSSRKSSRQSWTRRSASSSAQKLSKPATNSLKCKFGIQLALKTTGPSLARTSKGFLKRAIGAFILFDVCSESSFKNTERWLQDLRNNTSPQIVIFLIGNKIDEFQR